MDQQPVLTREPICQIELCTDCTHLAVNAEHPIDPEPGAPAPLSLLVGADYTPGMMRADHICLNEDGCECEHTDFSTVQCGGCGSYLPGYRHTFTVWSWGPA